VTQKTLFGIFIVRQLVSISYIGHHQDTYRRKYRDFK